MSFFQSEIPHLISTCGYAAVAGIVALESIGIPLPGETTLIAAALVAGTTNDLNVWLVSMRRSGERQRLCAPSCSENRRRRRAVQ